MHGTSSAHIFVAQFIHTACKQTAARLELLLWQIMLESLTYLPMHLCVSLHLSPVQVCFLTSPCRGAGTDSCVSLELRGSKGSSGPITVSAGHEAFQRGGSDTFTYKWPYLGQLQQLVVWHDNSGAASAGGRGPWCLEAVVVTSRTDQQVVTFPYGSWLAAEAKLKVELLPGQNVGLTR